MLLGAGRDLGTGAGGHAGCPVNFDLATSELLSHARNITLLAEEGEGSFSSVAKRANERKARLLLGALGVEVVGVGLVAAALGVAFAT